MQFHISAHHTPDNCGVHRNPDNSDGSPAATVTDWPGRCKEVGVEFIKGGVPEGVLKFRSAISKDTKYTFIIPGIYAYWCTPHKGMGMIGFVVVGNNKSNLEAIKKIKYLGKSKKIAQELISSL